MTAPKGNSLTGKNKAGRNRIIAIALIALLVLVPTMLEFGILFSRSNYIILLLCFVGIYAIANSGFDLLFGYTGQMSLGQAGFYGIGAYCTTLLCHPRYGLSAWLGFSLPPILTIFIAAFIAMLFGIMLAFPASNLVHHFLALLTMAFGQLVFLVISSFPDITNGYSGMTGIPPIKIFGIEFDTNYKFYLLALAFSVLFLILKQNIVNSRVGRNFIAIRENQLAANGSGVDVKKYKIMAFALSSFYTGFAGALYAHFIGFISPESFMYAQSIVFLTMLVFGGNGNFIGPVLGALVITITQEAMQSLMTYQMLIYGAFLLVTILFLPKGIYGLILMVRKYFGKAVKRKNAES